jgi:hypothetical protein
MIYLTTPSVSKTVYCQLVGRVTSEEFERMYKEAAVAYFNVVIHGLATEPGEIHKKIYKDGGYQGRNSNQGLQNASRKRYRLS